VIRGRWGTSAAVLTLLLAAGCGRRGPPLQPFVRIPDAVSQIDARRAGDEVYVTLTVPAQNADLSLPVVIDRVEVYAYTGVTPPPQGRWVEIGTRVATVPVVVPEPGTDVEPIVSGVLRTGPALPDEILTIRDVLSADELEQGPVLQGETAPRVPIVAPTAAPVPALRRFYTAYAFDPLGRPSPPGALADVAVEAPPPAPVLVRATYTEEGLGLAWSPSGGLLGFLLEQSRPPEPPPRGVRVPALSGAESSGPTRYNVYLARTGTEEQAAPVQADGDSWRVVVQSPINAAPVADLAFNEPVRFGIERCYVVRAARGAGVTAVESGPSPELCLTPEDVFPPAPPTELVLFPAAGRINLIWEPSIEADLGGYLVLRGAPDAAALQPITASPVREARFLDDNVTAGVRYAYAVVAVDRRAPEPNRSRPSARVEFTAR
jgi:hypothetical protein